MLRHNWVAPRDLSPQEARQLVSNLNAKFGHNAVEEVDFGQEFVGIIAKGYIYRIFYPNGVRTIGQSKVK
jgi:hypothetical protein